VTVAKPAAAHASRNTSVRASDTTFLPAMTRIAVARRPRLRLPEDEYRLGGQEGSSDREWSSLPEQQDRAAGKEPDCAAFPRRFGSFSLQSGLSPGLTRHVRAPGAVPGAGLVAGRHLGASRLVLVAGAGPPEDHLQR
jgi:hypothetical protein